MSDTPIFPITAAGGNSRAARSLRARLQLRDRFGRFAWMGGGLKFKVRGSNGRVHSVIGSFVGARDENTGQVYVRNDDSGLPDGFYDVKSSNAEVITADLPEDFLRQQGIDPNATPTERVAEEIPQFADMRPKAAPEGWNKVPGKFNGKNVIETEDGDFRLHHGGADDRVLLEDHRANPGQAVPQRSVAEAFRKVAEVDAQREASGDESYTLSENADGPSRDDLVEQLKFNERTLSNPKATLDAQTAARQRHTEILKELEASGEPYDPEGNDSDEAFEARKNAAEDATIQPEAGVAGTGEIDTSTFEVSPEGYLIPTGRVATDLSPEGLARFLEENKDYFAEGGGKRLVVDTDAGTAEIYNSADSLDNARAQAGGLGKDSVLDLAEGREVSVSEGAVDPNSPDVNPNLEGDTSPEAPNAEDSNPDAVESQGPDAGADAPASPEPDAEAGRAAVAEPAPAGGDTGPDADRGADAPAAERSGAAPGSVEELQQRRAQVQTALENSGDPKDIIALNEQADALDNRIASKSGSPLDENGKRIPDEEGLIHEPEDVRDWTDTELEDYSADAVVRGERNSEKLTNVREEIQRRRDEPAAEESSESEADLDAKLSEIATSIENLQKEFEFAQQRLNASTTEEEDTSANADIDRLFDEIADLEDQYAELDARTRSGGGEDEKSDDIARAEIDLENALEDHDAAVKANASEAQIRRNEQRVQEAADKLINDLGQPRPEGNWRLDAILDDSKVSARSGEPGSRDVIDAERELADARENFREARRNNASDRDLNRREDEVRAAEARLNEAKGIPQEAAPEPEAVDPTPEVDPEVARAEVDLEMALEAYANALKDFDAPRALLERHETRIKGAAQKLTDMGQPLPENNRHLDMIMNDSRVSAPEGDTPGNPTQEVIRAEIELADAKERQREAFRTGASDRDRDRRADEVQRAQERLDAARGAVEGEPEAAPEVDAQDVDWASNPAAPTREEISAAPPGAIVAQEHNESGDKRLFRKREDGRWEQISTDGSGRPLGYTTRGDTLHYQGSNFHYVSDLNASRPEDPEAVRRREEQLARIEREESAQRTAPAVPGEGSPQDENNYQEPGDADEISVARSELTAIDNEIESELSAAENSSDEMEEATHLSRVRTLERQRKVFENKLNRALGNAPMDFNRDLGWSMTDRDNRGEFPEAPELPSPSDQPLSADETEAPEDPGTPMALDSEAPDLSTSEDRLVAAEQEQADAERAYTDVFLQDSWTEEEAEAATRRRDEARYEVQRLTEDRDYMDAGEMEEADMRRQAEEDYGPDLGWDAPEAQMSEGQEESIERLREVLSGAEETRDLIDEAGPEGLDTEFGEGDNPDNTAPGHDNAISAAKAKMQGKEMSDEERSVISEALDSGSLSDNQLDRIVEEIDAKPNRANTTTVARPENEQPEYLSTADMEIINAERDDPDFVYEEDLVWRTIQEEFPDATFATNGDLILETTTKVTGPDGRKVSKRYDLMARRTANNRFSIYVLETDQHSNRRAKRIPGEWHSYEALEKRIQRGRKILAGNRPSSFFANNKETPTENLGAQDFPGDDFLGNLMDPDAPLTGDERFDHLIQAAAQQIREGNVSLNDIEASLTEMEPSSAAVQVIMNAIIGRMQTENRPASTDPWQMYDGTMAEPGMHVDWTDWHEMLDWWVTDSNGRRVLNPDRRANPDHGRVHRAVIVKYEKSNSDGKGRNYGDHVVVQFIDSNGNKVGTQRRVATQTLRPAEEGSTPGAPFFAKKEEWRGDPEAVSRVFRVPNSGPDEPVVTHERPTRELGGRTREITFTPRGTLPGYSNVPVPTSPSEIAGLLGRGDVVPEIKPASDIRTGTLVVRMDDAGNQHVDSVLRVENLGDGGFRIHLARPDGEGKASVDSIILDGNTDVATFTSPPPRVLPTPRKKAEAESFVGKAVEYDFEGRVGNGIVLKTETDGTLWVDGPDGQLLMMPPEGVTQLSRAGAASAIRADLMELLESADIPPALRQSIMYKLFSSRTTSAMIGQLTQLVNSFDTKTPRSRDMESIFNILKIAPTVQNRIREAMKVDQ